MTSVIIPAHNEASAIARCLEALQPSERPDELEVIVVCNGCSDSTAERAASFEHVRVIETPAASKTGALNLGDRAASGYPRIYLDADIELPRRVVDELAGRLEETGLPAATVRFEIDLSSASKAVVRHFRARSAAPYPDHVVGRGVYCLSAEGRRRFGEFPAVIGDDLFVQSLIRPEECAVVDDFAVAVRVPETLPELVRVQSRVAAGNREHRRLFPESRQQGSRWELVRAHRRPGRWLDLATFVSVVAASRLLARIRAVEGSATWETTRSSVPGDRTPVEAAGRLETTRRLGMPVSLVSWPELEGWASGAVGGCRGVTVCTVAPYQFHLWRSDPNYAAALERASAVLVDGNGVRIALYAAGVRSHGRRTGREVVERLYDGRMLGGARLAVVGSSAASQQVLAERRPGWLVLGGLYPSEPTPAMVAETAALLERAGIEVALVALGSPKGELWADALAQRHPAVYFSVGGAIDTVTGTRRPPPRTVERLGLEWAWRLAQDPPMAARLARAAQVMPALVGRALRGGREGGAGPAGRGSAA